MDITQLAREYLANSPTGWLTISKLISRQISVWGAAEVQGLDGSITEDKIVQGVFQELTSPSLITLIAGSNTPMEAHDLLSRSIDDLLKDTPLGIPLDSKQWAYKPHFSWDPDSERKPMEEPSHSLESYTTAGSFYEGYSDPEEFQSNALDRFYDKSNISSAIQSIVEDDQILQNVETDESVKEATPDIAFRLDVIDLALYKALLQHPELLQSIEWRVFEKLLADILGSFGYEIELQRGTKDGGVDLFAIKRVDPLGPQRFLLQAKRWSNKVGVEPVRQLAFLHSHYRVTKACLATTSTFTRGAWELSNQYRWQLELRDHLGLQEWLRQAASIRTNF